MTCKGCGALAESPVGSGKWYCYGYARFECRPGSPVEVVNPDNQICKYEKEREQ